MFNTVNASLYHYAANNPVRYIDPDGREDWDESGTKATVTENDALWKITKTFNDANGTNISYDEVATVNNIKNPNRIETNKVIDFSAFLELDSVEIEHNVTSHDDAKKLNLIQTWWQKPVGAPLTDAEAKLQSAIGTIEMIGGPIAGIGLCEVSGGQSFVLGMYVMADGAYMFSQANEKKKAYPFSLLPTFLLPYAKTDDGMIFYTGF